MKEELRKRLEEAAKNTVHKRYGCFADEYPCRNSTYCIMCGGENTAFDCCECPADDFHEGVLEGITLGYKEAIAKAKEWLKSNVSDYAASYIVGCSKGAFISDFETDMNKLWEEKK